MARQFDGSGGDYLSAAIQFLEDSNGPFTVALWFKAGTTGGGGAYVMDTGDVWAIIYEFAGDKLEFYAVGYSGTDPRTDSGITISDTNWHHVAWRKTGSGAGAWDRFLDGTKTQINASIDFTLFNGTADFTIGSQTGGANSCNAHIAEVAVWTSALTDGNLASLAAGAVANDIAATQYYWRILGDAAPEPEYNGGTSLALTGTAAQSAHPFSTGSVVPILVSHARRFRG